MFKRCFLVVVMCFLFVWVKAQEKRDLKQEVKVVSLYKAKLKEAHRIGFLPKIDDSLIEQPVFTYSIFANPEVDSFKPTNIDAASMKSSSMSHLKSHYLHLAGANYSSLIGEYRFNNKESSKYNYGALLKHYSTKGTIGLRNKQQVSPNLKDNYAQVYFAKYMSSSKILVNAIFDNKSMNYYGYPNRKNIPAWNTDLYPYYKQYYRNMSVGIDYHTHNPEGISSVVSFKYNRLDDKYRLSENDFKLNVFLFKKKGNHLLGVFIDNRYLHTANIQDHLSYYKGQSRKSILVGVNPFYTFINDKFSLKLGGKFIKGLSDESGIYVYPDVKIECEVVDGSLSLIAGVDGDIHLNSTSILSKENPYIATGLSGSSSKEKYHAFSGVKGNLSTSISYKAMLEYSAIDDQYFFDIANSSSSNFTLVGEAYSNKFALAYDDIKVFNANAEISVKWNNKLNLSSRADFYKYKMSNLPNAWYMPKFKLNLDANYILIDDLKLNVGLVIVGKRKAHLVIDRTLKSVYDLHFGADYKINKYLSVYAKVNNLFAYKYYQYANYPSQALNTWFGVKLYL